MFSLWLINLKQIQHAHIIKTLNAVFSDCIKKNKLELFVMSIINVIPTCKTFYNSTNELSFKENTISETLNIINDIFRKYVDLDDEFYFKKNNKNDSLYLVYDDQLIVQKVRICQQRRVEKNDAFENLKWILFIFAMFHLQMITIQLINETHYDSESEFITDRSKLRWAKKALNRERVKSKKENSDFYSLKQFLKHCFQTRITVVLTALLKKDNRAKNLENVKKKLNEMSIQSFRFWIEAIVKKLFRTFTFINRLNAQYCNHIFFCQQWMTYVTFKHEIKHEDINMLRQFFTQLAVLFNDTVKHNYAFETLYLHWFTNIDAVDKELQHVILMNSLINLRDEHDFWYFIDLSQEMQNLHVKKLMIRNRTSSFTSKNLFNYCSFNSTHIKKRLIALKRLYVVKRNTKQALKSAKNDIQKLCETLRHDVLKKSLRKTTEVSCDLMHLRLATLIVIEVTKFNSRQCDNDYIITNNDVNENSDVLNYIEKNKDDREDVDLRDTMIVNLKMSNLSKSYNEDDEDDNNMINNMY